MRFGQRPASSKKSSKRENGEEYLNMEGQFNAIAEFKAAHKTISKIFCSYRSNFSTSLQNNISYRNGVQSLSMRSFVKQCSFVSRKLDFSGPFKNTASHCTKIKIPHTSLAVDIQIK